jgi:hypothetical protein
MKTISKFLIFILVIFSCNEKHKTEKKNVNELINSKDVNDVVEGYFIIGEEKQVNYISEIFKNPSDNRISHHYRFKGISIYQSKMIAMKKISGLKPPVNINYKSDSLVISYYYNWALKNKYIKPNPSSIPKPAS